MAEAASHLSNYPDLPPGTPAFTGTLGEVGAAAQARARAMEEMATIQTNILASKIPNPETGLAKAFFQVAAPVIKIGVYVAGILLIGDMFGKAAKWFGDMWWTIMLLLGAVTLLYIVKLLIAWT